MKKKLKKFLKRLVCFSKDHNITLHFQQEGFLVESEYFMVMCERCKKRFMWMRRDVQTITSGTFK